MPIARKEPEVIAPWALKEEAVKIEDQLAGHTLAAVISTSKRPTDTSSSGEPASRIWYWPSRCDPGVPPSAAQASGNSASQVLVAKWIFRAVIHGRRQIGMAIGPAL
jgi:hypothetical protein